MERDETEQENETKRNGKFGERNQTKRNGNNGSTLTERGKRNEKKRNGSKRNITKRNKKFSDIVIDLKLNAEHAYSLVYNCLTVCQRKISVVTEGHCTTEVIPVHGVVGLL